MEVSLVAPRPLSLHNADGLGWRPTAPYIRPTLEVQQIFHSVHSHLASLRAKWCHSDHV